MSRSALRLAALASSAVPGLDPVSVESIPVRLGAPYEFAFVTDSQDRQWVVKAARSAASGALLEDVSTLMTLLARRLDVQIPLVRGVAALKSGRAVVHPRVPGQSLDFAQLPPAAALTAEVGRTLAHIHNLELLVFEEAGRPSYDAETHRKRMLSELDRASATGHVPTGLLSRWEHRLEDVSLWRFAPTPVHGAFTGSHVLASFEDEQDASSGRVRGVIGWEEARVGDPADDLAELVARAHPGALDTVLEAYVQSRIERPDTNLVRRARLAAEMSLVHGLLRALSAGETQLVEQLSADLRHLDERVQEAERRAEARRLRAEREARRERELAQAAAASTPSTTRPDGFSQTATAGSGTSVDEATQPFAGPVPAADEATQPFAGPSPANDEATQPFAGPSLSADELTQPFHPFPGAGSGLDSQASRSLRGAEAAAPQTPTGGDPQAATERPAEQSWQLSTAVDPEGLFEIDAVEPLSDPRPVAPTHGGPVTGGPVHASQVDASQGDGTPVDDSQADGAVEDGSADDGQADGAVDDRHEGASDYVPVERAHDGDRQVRP